MNVFLAVFWLFFGYFLVMSSDVLHCMGSEKEGLVQTVNLLIYLIKFDHVASSSSMVE